MSQVHPQAQAILDAASEAGGAPLNEMPVADARAALDEIPKNFGVPLADVARIDRIAILGPNGAMDARMIVPHDAGSGPLPLLIYYHGGGWVLGHVESHLREACYYAAGAGCAVLVVSEELDELFEICDRLHVMANGKMSPSVHRKDATVAQIGEWMSGLWEAHAQV